MTPLHHTPGWLHPSPLLIGYPWNHKLNIFRSRSICESCRKSGTIFLKIFCTHIRRSDSKLLDFQVPRYLKSGLGRAGLGPWVGPWQCCAGARRQISGNLEIQKFGIPWNPCDKDFRILDLLEPLRQRFQNFGPTGTLALKISRFPNHSGNTFHLRYQ